MIKDAIVGNRLLESRHRDLRLYGRPLGKVGWDSFREVGQIHWPETRILENPLLPNDVIVFAPVECDLPQGLSAECKPG
jgi:hypothetical protein